MEGSPLPPFLSSAERHEFERLVLLVPLPAIAFYPSPTATPKQIFMPMAVPITPIGVQLHLLFRRPLVNNTGGGVSLGLGILPFPLGSKQQRPTPETMGKIQQPMTSPLCAHRRSHCDRWSGLRANVLFGGHRDCLATN